jgi:hypothetical protein
MKHTPTSVGKVFFCIGLMNIGSTDGGGPVINAGTANGAQFGTMMRSITEARQSEEFSKNPNSYPSEMDGAFFQPMVGIFWGLMGFLVQSQVG